jgi:hypothetical protein
LRSALLITLLACLAAVPVARADGDPASDYLLGQQAFVPPDAAVSSSDSRQLLALVTGARASGYTIRVALIASRYDLGSVTVLDKRPKLYAHFLSQELRFLYKKRVLVVMSNGYGIARNGKPDPAEQKVLDRLPPPGSAYAGAAARAVRALAAHAGVHVVPSSITSARASGGTSTRDRLLIALGGLALVCAVLFATLYRRWR